MCWFYNENTQRLTKSCFYGEAGNRTAIPGLQDMLKVFLWPCFLAQPAVVLVFKRLKRWGNGLKSHSTDWEKPGNEPATPGLQDTGFSPTPRRLLKACLKSHPTDWKKPYRAKMFV